ncbi:hypothetical protein ACLQ28_18110 [Micromonospora sp. DT201]|uniref:hypothetical protein n=1 Tax=Micromonospora sp. DT201 TaxID=3393442 RepID=UPI003CEF3E03
MGVEGSGCEPSTFADELTTHRTVFRWAHRYNTCRRHSACGNISPNAYEAHHAAALTAAA